MALRSYQIASVLLSLVLGFSQAHAEPPAPAAKTQLILIGVDGFSYNAFHAARARGLFKDFGNIGAHVAPFPTMTDLSWSNMMHTTEVFGDQGRIKDVEATHFDDATQSIKGDPRDYYQRLGHPKYYLGAFENIFNPYLEGLVYFPTEEIPRMEIRTVVDQLLAARPATILTAYIGSVDSTAHTQGNRLFPVLVDLDKELTRLIAGFRAKGIEPDIMLVSDHGNIGRFLEGNEEGVLNGVEIEPVIKRAGLNSVQQLLEPKDVAIPLLALGTWAPVYFKDRANRAAFIGEFLKEPWFDQALYVNRNNATETVVTVISALGRATVRYDKVAKSYFYTPVEGNPLGLEEKWINTSAKTVAIPESWSLTATVNSPYPDSLHRIARAGSFEQFDFPDLIITLKDGNFIKGPLAAMTKMFRTHGSLTKGSSLGIVVSNVREVPGQVRGEDILPMLGVNAKNLYGKLARSHNQSSAEALGKVMGNLQKGVETQAGDFSQKRVFQHMQKFISDSRPFFIVNEMSAFKDAFKFNPFSQPNAQTMSPLNFDASKFDVTSFISNDDLGVLTDIVIRNPDVDKIMADPKVQEIKGRLDKLAPTQQSQMDAKALKDPKSLADKARAYLVPARRSAMKLYQLPYLLEKSLVIQEKSFLPEIRDIMFARSWVANRDSYVSSNTQLGISNVAVRSETGAPQAITPAEALLKETFKENELEEKIFPTPLDKIYNHKLSRKTTIVYVPGLYNNLFDKEIFSLGINAIADDLGLRVLVPPVHGICSADYNADILLNYLKQDREAQLARGNEEPDYLILGYSKGGVDALSAFVKDPEFTSKHVLGLVTIAAPLHGSSILNKSDVPFALISALSDNAGPEICHEEKTASKSINPVAMQSFWRKNAKALTGLTRYFSVSFVSEPENSHLFMRATKLIAQFDEDNDGVVTISSSKFPGSLGAVDLGVVHADHLAGILASRFNQSAFMKAVVNTMAELDIENTKNNYAINSQAIMSQIPSSGSLFRSMLKSAGLAKVQVPAGITNTYELNKALIPKVADPADSWTPSVTLPQSQIKYDPYNVLDIAKLGDVMAGTRVRPAEKNAYPQGIDITWHHKNMVHFRMDHQFNWESRTPGGMDDNTDTGWANATFNGEPDWAVLRSKNNSIRLTTLSYRFKPTEFSKMQLKIAVTKGVKGADPVKGKTGIDDSAFQVWFSIREKNVTGDRTYLDAKQDKVVLFGYYWGDPVAGEDRKAGALYENSWSNKNVVVATLPEAYQILLNNQDQLGKAQLFERNLAQDLAKAFPGRDVNDMEIIAITIQHDSNDAKDSSEAYFKSLKFMP